MKAHNLTQLYRYLLTDYEKDVRPSIRHDLPINVSFIFSLTQIIDVVSSIFYFLNYEILSYLCHQKLE